MPSTMTSAREAGGTKGGVILSGAVKDVYSKEILFNAQPNLVFSQFADRRTELGREAGDTIKFTRYDDLHGTTKLSEVENITTAHLSSRQVSIQVDEHAYAVAETERLLRTSWDDVMARVTRLLGQNYGRTVDGLIRDEIRSAGSLQTIFPTDGYTNRADLVAGDVLNVKSIKDANESLATNKAIKINGVYVCTVHPHQARGLRDDDAWIDAHRYTNPAVEGILRGEIGMMEGVRFIETTFVTLIKPATYTTPGAVLADGIATGEVQAVEHATLDVYQALVLGGNCVGWAEALPVEIRDNGVVDFGRTRELAWYSIMGAGQIRPENAVVIETV